MSSNSQTLPKRAYTVRDFCATYGVGRTLTYQLISAGRLEARHVGKRTLIDAGSAEQWYASLPVGLSTPAIKVA